MTIEDFKQKWTHYIEKGFEKHAIGIHHPKVLEWLNSEFEEAIQLDPNFNFTQIKLKFNYARVYSTSSKNRYWEEGIDLILDDN